MDPYAVLGVAPSAEPGEIRKAYFRLVRVHTPEDDPAAFGRITAAYELLSDPEKRAEHDAHAAIPEASRIALERAREAIEGDPGGAVRLALALARDRSQPDPVRYEATSVLGALDRFDAALEVLQGLVERHPDEVRYVAALASCHHLLKQFGSARTVLEEALDRHPLEAELYSILSRVHFSAGRTAPADAVLVDGIRRIGALEFGAIDLHFMRIKLAAQIEQPHEIENTAGAIEAAIPAGDRDARLHVADRYVDVGNLLNGKGRFREAVFCFERAAELAEDAHLRERAKELLAAGEAREEGVRALDNRKVASWIRELLLLHFGYVTTNENPRNVKSRVRKHCTFREQEARREWRMFAQRYPCAAAAILPLLHEIVPGADRRFAASAPVPESAAESLARKSAKPSRPSSSREGSPGARVRAGRSSPFGMVGYIAAAMIVMLTLGWVLTRKSERRQQRQQQWQLDLDKLTRDITPEQAQRYFEERQREIEKLSAEHPELASWEIDRLYRERQREKIRNLIESKRASDDE